MYHETAARAMYADMIAEGVPERFIAILRRLEEPSDKARHSRVGSQRQTAADVHREFRGMARRNAATKKEAGSEPRAGCRDLSVNQIG
jgi:hypothetical protein